MTQTVDPFRAAFEQHNAGNTAAAEPIYRQILATEPNRHEVLHLLGALCVQTDRPAEAVELIGRAIALHPTSAEYFNHLGAAYGALAQLDEAITTLRRAVQLAPRSASFHYNLGTALLHVGKREEAVLSFRHAVAADSQSAEAHYNLANTLRELKRPSEAEASYRDALRVRPGYLKAMINLANVLREQERFAEAVDVLREAVEIDPRHGNAQLNLGTLLRDAGRFDEAVEPLERAIELQPNSAQAHNNLGTALQCLGRFDEADAHYELALQLDNELPDVHFSRATSKLRRGDLAGGFAEYEWRWKCATFSEPPFTQPRWRGEPLDGRTIFLYSEQGLGDTLQFVRFVAQVKARGAGRILFKCQPPLLPLLASCPGIDELLLIELDSSLPAFDVQAPLLSLPAILEISQPAELSSAPYLFADEALIAHWKQTIAPHRGIRVGACWQGNPKHMFNRQRSFPLSALAPLGTMDAVRIVSLQKGAGTEEIADAPFEVIELRPALDEQAGAFMDTAAVMKSLDLVVTCDTAVAHLAGALGVPVWLAVSAHPDWRWMLDRQDCPWYPTMRLFRQTKLGEWSDVFQRMAREIEQRRTPLPGRNEY